MKQPLIVLKFGSSVLSTCSRLPAVVHEIYRAYRRGSQVVAVVSAIGRHTDLLIDEANRINNPAAPASALAQLVSTGEQQSAALLTMALHRAGIPCELLDITTACLVLGGERLDATPLTMDIDTVYRKLAVTPVLVLPGFIGCHESGGTALMGRGGSDLTAVFLADQLKAQECRLVKDVDGIYERDPAKPGRSASNERPHRYGTVTYEVALRVAEVLVQPKAVEYLQASNNTAKVSALLHEDGTEVGSPMTTTADVPPSSRLNVLLLGLGTVGQGVYQHLQELPEFFEVIGILVRDVVKHAERGVPRNLLDSDVAKLMARRHDLIVDVCGDRKIAYSLIAGCLEAGCPAVTASKQLVADHGVELLGIAERTGAGFNYSAAVGGSAPMVEAVRRVAELGEIVRLRGVLSGTCNYVLDRLASGITFKNAVVEARELGYAESDAARDLSGQDTEDKLRILARTAFGAECDNVPISRQGLERLTQQDFDLAKARGQLIRLVATIDAGGKAIVAPEALAIDDFLAGAKGVENRLIIDSAAGRSWQVRGKGAGRWPTAEAVIADMLDFHAAKSRAQQNTQLRAPLANTRSDARPPILDSHHGKRECSQHAGSHEN